MSIVRVIDERVLAPIGPGRAAGEDLSASGDWVAIRKSRPNPYDTQDKKGWERADSSKADWSALQQLTETALCTKTKDLRLAWFLAEASIKLHGFTGVRDGVWAIRNLVTQFWDSGLYPLMEDGDASSRAGSLGALNTQLAEALREIPITLRSASGKNFSLNHQKESLRQGGSVSASEFEAAVAAGSLEQYQELSTTIAEARKEFDEFEAIALERLGQDGISLEEAKEAFAECRQSVDSIVRKKTPAPATTSGNGTSTFALGFGLSTGPGAQIGGGWAEAEQMVRDGKVDGALAAMGALAAAEPNGRIRFQRKLLLAEICLQTGRERLAKSILEELAELIDKHQLESWETSDVIGAVWTRLYRCYSNEEAKIADPDKAAQLLLRLCRLDPWQALMCSDKRSL
jgi:type VI secretion system protein ImpA